MKICKIVKMAKNHFQGGHWDLEDYQLTFFSSYRLIIDFLIQNVVQLKIRFFEQIDTPVFSSWPCSTSRYCEAGCGNWSWSHWQQR